MPDRLYMGIDIGSVSLNLVVLDHQQTILKEYYQRTNGQPLSILLNVLNEIRPEIKKVHGIVCTGSARKLVSSILNCGKAHEIIAHTRAATHFFPAARTIIEIGGQDSKLMILKAPVNGGRPVILDHALNELCAAGTGAFLDQQAYRLGMTIEEFSRISEQSERPASIAGRCSVFAKSDMIHLQQQGAPKEDIVAGLCYALARNYLSNLGKGKLFTPPIVFQGGVAGNQGVVRAFKDLLGLSNGQFIVPPLHGIMGAFGAAMLAREGENVKPMEIGRALDVIVNHLRHYATVPGQSELECIKRNKVRRSPADNFEKYLPGKTQNAFLGIDVGSVSTKIAVLDEGDNLADSVYLLSQGNPISSLKTAFSLLDRKIKSRLDIKGVSVTGSARYLVGDFVGADRVINEITAQAKAALHLDPKVDTIFEIGGQDSKYIRIKDGVVVDFEMNKVCAAGTGSFLHEQADRLNVDIDKEFSELAFASRSPVNIGTRCTVFMESDLVHHQQIGTCREDLLAGLAYCIGNNYIEKVVGGHPIGEHIFFQGGVAGNHSVVGAMQNIVGKTITVPPHHFLTGAIGAALTAKEHAHDHNPSRFFGFNLEQRPYSVKTFECHHCPNHCEIKKATLDHGKFAYYGGICGRYEKKKQSVETDFSDLFSQREKMLLSYATDQSNFSGPIIGIPRCLMTFEHFPFWSTFFNHLGCRVVLSDRSNRAIIHKGLRKIQAESCYPIKIAYGHVVNLIEKNVDYIFLPVEISQPKTKDARFSYNCPLIQTLYYQMKPAFEEKTRFLAPAIHFSAQKDFHRQLLKTGRHLGKPRHRIKSAIRAAASAQAQFKHARIERGTEFIEALGDHPAVVLVGKPYNIHDMAQNLGIPAKLRRLGMPVLPFDFLDSGKETLPKGYDTIVWANKQAVLKSCMRVKKKKNLSLIHLTNFGCGPDSFLPEYLKEIMGKTPFITLEIDEHTNDAAVITRIEAFLDTQKNIRKRDCNLQIPETTVLVKSEKGGSGGHPAKEIRTMDKTIYVPNSCLHEAVSVACLRASGIDAQLLPYPDEESESIGRKLVSGRECHPFILMAADLVKMSRLPGFDPQKSAFLMSNSEESCRLHQYGINHKRVLNRLGLEQVEVIAPVSSDMRCDYTSLFGGNCSANLYKTGLFVDILYRKLLHIRPYEVNQGETDQVMETAGRRLIDSVGSNVRQFNRTITKILADFDRIPVKRQERPIIGIIGEIYDCINTFTNNDIVKELEALGAEVRLGPTYADFSQFYAERYPAGRISQGKYFQAAAYFMRNQLMQGVKQRVDKHLGKDLSIWAIPKATDIIRRSAAYVDTSIHSILTVNLAKAKHYAVNGCSGIVNIYPLNCLMGITLCAITRKIQKEHDGLPILTMIFDGLKQTNEQTRIEAFVNQAGIYHSNRN